MSSARAPACGRVFAAGGCGPRCACSSSARCVVIRESIRSASSVTSSRHCAELSMASVEATPRRKSETSCVPTLERRTECHTRSSSRAASTCSPGAVKVGWRISRIIASSTPACISCPAFHAPRASSLRREWRHCSHCRCVANGTAAHSSTSSINSRRGRTSATSARRSQSGSASNIASRSAELAVEETSGDTDSESLKSVHSSSSEKHTCSVTVSATVRKYMARRVNNPSCERMENRKDTRVSTQAGVVCS
eukprot:6190553-Pleurochrysis_carterae.AAC.3